MKSDSNSDMACQSYAGLNLCPCILVGVFHEAHILFWNTLLPQTNVYIIPCVLYSAMRMFTGHMYALYHVYYTPRCVTFTGHNMFALYHVYYTPRSNTFTGHDMYTLYHVYYTQRCDAFTGHNMYALYHVYYSKT